jgi:hypothetical protein
MSITKQQVDVKQQWPSYSSTAGDWVAGKGHSHYWTARRFLDALSQYRASLPGARSGEPLSPTWLLPFRNDFRQLIADKTAAAIQWHLFTGDPELRTFFLWLMSRQADRFHLLGLDDYADDPSPQVRRHIAKSLRRLEAWAQLRELALENPDDAKIQWFATVPTTRRPFAERLKDFTSIVDDSHAGEVFTPSRMPFWSLERVWERTPPKSIELMRRMLRRIRHWVRWGVS